MLGLLAVPGVSGAPGPNLVGVSGSPKSKSPEFPGSPGSKSGGCLPALESPQALQSAQCARSPDCIWEPWVQVWCVPPELASLLRLLSVFGFLAPVSVSGAPASLVGLTTS